MAHQLFFWGGTGVLLLTALTAIAVIVYFARHPSLDGLWPRVIAPTLAALALLVIPWLATVNFDTLLGVAPDAPVRWGIPAAYAAAMVLGTGWALVLRRARPHTYDRIGMGARAATIGSNLGLAAPDQHRTADPSGAAAPERAR